MAAKYQDIFPALWRQLEEAADKSWQECDNAIIHVLEELAALKCSCILAAPALFAGVLSQPILIAPTTKGLSAKGRRALIYHIHNLVNLKLQKPIFRDLTWVDSTK